MRHLAHYLLLLALLVALGFFISRSGQVVRKPLSSPRLVYEFTSTPQFLEQCGPLAADKKPVVVTMLSSEDKREWLEPAARGFGHLCPNIQVRLSIVDSFKAIDDIVGGRLRPTLWSPSSAVALRYLEHRWKKDKGVSLVKNVQPVSLLRSPAIWLMRDNRYQALIPILASRQSDEGQWLQAGCPRVARSPESGSPASEGWKPTKFAHASPARSFLGVETLHMLAYDYLLPPKVRSAAKLGPDSATTGDDFTRAMQEQRGSLCDWLRHCEGGVQDFRDSSRELVKEFFDLGASRHDIVVAYEQEVLPFLDHLRRYPAGTELLRVVYPAPTPWADHPVAMLGLDPNFGPEQRTAAEKWIAYLLSDVMQTRAVELGFRPSRQEASVRDYNAEPNLFLRLGSRGVQVTLPRHEPPPIDGESVEALLKTWGEATGRY